MSQPAPRSVANYEVEGELGRGGMGVVYLARQPALERPVVLKTLRRDLEDPRVEERFQREARAAARVHHQNVVAVYDCFQWRGRSWIAQEYVDGVDLATALREAGRLDARSVALVTLELLRGLEEIHARGVVHRDLKPANVLLGRGGEVKIADFGIAQGGGPGPALTQTGEAVGTPQYMSPEQLCGERVDPRSDLFSLGVIAYEMLTGTTPFASGDGPGDVLLRRIEGSRYRPLRRAAPGTPRWLGRLVRHCLRPKARRRPGSTGDLRRRLERRLLDPSPSDARREVAARLWERGVFGSRQDATQHRPAAPPPVPRRPLRWAAAAALLAALALGLWEHQRGGPARDALASLLGRSAPLEAAAPEIPAEEARHAQR